MATCRHSNDLSMDEWLDNQGFYRKHTAKDGSCLFRAVSEQIFKTQAIHLNVRQSCINYMTRNRDKFEKSDVVDGSFDDHILNMQNPKEAATQSEIDAMSLLFKRDFLSFHEIGKPAYKLTDNGFDEKVIFYLSGTNHYDSVFSKTYIIDAAFCQSLVYEILYKKVFDIGDEVDFAVEKMLHDKVYAKLRKDSTTSIDSNCGISPDFILDHEDESWDDKDGVVSDVRRALAQGYPPFPYKVAKALDSEIYRNVEFDVWNDAQKDEMKFEPGVKCLVRLDKDKPDSYHAHIQEVTPNKGPVTVYIVELGEKQTVPYESLESLPSSFRAGWQSPFGKNYKPVSTYYHKPHINGNIIEIDKYKGRKGKKGKFKDVSYSLPPLPRGQSLPPRMQSQFDSSILPLGRGRNTGPFHGVGRNPSPHVKWVSPQNQRYHYNRNNSNSGNRYMASNVGMNCHINNNSSNGSGNNNYNRVYNKVSSYEPPLQRNGTPKQNFTSSTPTCTSVTWAKSIGAVPQMQPHVNSFESGTIDNGSTNLVSQPSSNDLEVPPLTTVPTNVPSHVPTSYSSSTTAYTGPQATLSPSSVSCSVNMGSIPAFVPSSSPAPVSPNQSQPSYGSSPQPPITVYPCYTGVCIPYEPPIHPINYSIARSQDPNGMDLPFQDLATLRFFFNLGCDYFRVSSITQVPSSPPPYAVWNYATQVEYPQSMNGYLTPVSNTDSCDIVEGSLGSTGGTTAAPSPEQSEGEYGTPVEELYEAAYVYSSPPLGFVPGLWAQSIDYSSPPIQGVQNGLVMNDQGILSLSPTPCYPLQQSFPLAPSNTLQGPPRHRSDSGSSGRSQQGANVESSRGNYNVVNSRSKPKYSSGYSFDYQNGGGGGSSNRASQGSYNRQFSPRGNAQNNLPPRFQQRRNPQPNRHQQQGGSSYMGGGGQQQQQQPMMQMGMSSSSLGAPPPSQATQSFPIGSSLLAASPTSIGLYSGGSPVSQGTLFAATPTYYSPPHHHHPPPPPLSATIVYSPTNPHTIPYLPPSAQ